MEKLLILASLQYRYLKLLYNIYISSIVLYFVWYYIFLVSVLAMISGLKESMIDRLLFNTKR
jgi:hypothetical protein